MSAVVIGLALFAAILHATWNAFLRNGGDRLWTVTVMSFASTVFALPFLFIYPLPTSGAWLYIVLSAALTGWIQPLPSRRLSLRRVRAGLSDHARNRAASGDAQRFVITGEKLNSYQIAGVVLVAAGIMSLALGKERASFSSILLALATGAIIAAYATVDSIGVRETGQSGTYTAWVLVLYGAFLPAAFLALRRRLIVDFRAPETWKALAGGLVAMIAYGVVVAAFALGTAGPIMALRETSVVFAVLIGWLFLGETLTVRRILACLIVASGAILLGR